MQLNMESKMDKRILNKGISTSISNSTKKLSYWRVYVPKIIYCVFALSFILFIIVATLYSDYKSDNIHGILYLLRFIPVIIPVCFLVFLIWILFKRFNETKRIHKALSKGKLLCLKFDDDNIIIIDNKGIIRTIYYGDLLYIKILDGYIIFKCKELYKSFCIDSLYKNELLEMLKKKKLTDLIKDYSIQLD